jgi:hypothetical protein
MIVEHTASHHFPFDYLNTDIQITITVRCTSPGTPGVNVAIDLSFEALLDEPLQEVFDQFLSQAIHEGLAAIGQPVEGQGLQIDVPTLTITPIAALVQDGKLVGEIIRIIEFMLSSVVATLGTTLSTLDMPTMVRKSATKKRQQS